MNPNDPQAWFDKGHRDLELAMAMLPYWEKFPDILCYHCQQAAEKQLKALLLHHGQSVKRTHDLEELLDLLKVFESSIDVKYYNNALKINDYSILMRYPGLSVDPSEADVLEATASAVFFQDFVRKILGI